MRGKAYLILVSTPGTSVALSRTPTEIFLALDISPGGPGAGMALGMQAAAGISVDARLTSHLVGHGPAFLQGLAPSKQ